MPDTPSTTTKKKKQKLGSERPGGGRLAPRIAMAATGAGLVACAVPLAHFGMQAASASGRVGDIPAVVGAGAAAFLAGASLWAAGLCVPPEGMLDSDVPEWKLVQVPVCATAAVCGIVGAAMIEARGFTPSSTGYGTAGGVLTAVALALTVFAVAWASPPDKGAPDAARRRAWASRSLAAVAGAGTLAAGGALVSMTGDRLGSAAVASTVYGGSVVPLLPGTLRAAAGATFGAGWLAVLSQVL